MIYTQNYVEELLEQLDYTYLNINVIVNDLIEQNNIQGTELIYIGGDIDEFWL